MGEGRPKECKQGIDAAQDLCDPAIGKPRCEQGPYLAICRRCELIEGLKGIGVHKLPSIIGLIECFEGFEKVWIEHGSEKFFLETYNEAFVSNAVPRRLGRTHLLLYFKRRGDEL